MNQPARLSAPHERLGLRATDFELLASGGAFEDHGKTELIDGDIYVMSPQLARHARVKTRLLAAMLGRLEAIRSDLEPLVEVSVRVADDSVPEPDLVLSRYRGDRFVPGEMAALVVEVADSTLRTDLGRKAELYAAAGVPEYWVVDVVGRLVLMHANPEAGSYRDSREAVIGEKLTSVTIEGLEVDSVSLLA